VTHTRVSAVLGCDTRFHMWHASAVRVQVNSGMISPEDFVRVTSTAAAQIFNIYPRKGLIAAGSDADVIVLDPRIEHTISAATHHSRMDTNVYEGKRILGKVCTALCRFTGIRSLCLAVESAK
jgi:dihydroorotase-like cyclic amidohydrolase